MIVDLSMKDISTKIFVKHVVYIRLSNIEGHMNCWSEFSRFVYFRNQSQKE